MRLRQRIDRLQQQRALADARIAADQHHAATDDAAAEHAVEFLLAGRRALDIGRIDLGQSRHRLAARQRLVAMPARAGAPRRRPSCRVFQAWQCGQRPSQRGLVPPQSLQV